MQRGSFQWMKSLNKSIILNKIRTDGPISRAQIAKDTELTPPTVSSIVKELIDQSMVNESVLGTSKGGRKPTMLVINNNGFYIIGIDAGPKDIEFILSDLSGQMLDLASIPLKSGISKEEFIQKLKVGVDGLIQQHKKNKSKVIGIGVAMHGVVDAQTGTSLYAPNLNLRDIPIKEELEAAFGYSVKVENDAKAFALSEVWFGSSNKSTSMMAVNIGRGIGAGLIVNGKLYHGENNIAGEIGHMTVDIHGKRCECGNLGCLQTVASGPAIASRARTYLADKESSALMPAFEDGKMELTGKTVYEAAVAGNDLAKQIFEETGQYIGIGLTNLIHVVNPGKIIIGGGVSKSGSLILDPIKREIENRALTPQAKQTEVVLSELGEHATALGAVALLLTELFGVDAVSS